jgi:hypothetical protein
MGGSSSGPRRIPDMQGLIERAKKELSEKRNVFISFAYEDLNDVTMLRGQAKNENSPLEFNDWSVSEAYESERAEYIKQRITERINQSSLTVIYLSPASAKSRWVQWEIDKSIQLGKRVLAVYKGDAKPAIPFPALARHGIKAVPWKNLATEIDSLP